MRWVTVGAAAAYSTTNDMARYVAALLGAGTDQHGAILNPATLATMFEPHYQPDPRIPGMGLAFFRGNAGGHPVVEHQGIVPGFNSRSSGSRRRRRCPGLHQRCPPGRVVAVSRNRRAAQPPARRPRRANPRRGSTPPRDLGRPVRLVPFSGPLTDPASGPYGRRRRGLHQSWAAHVPALTPVPAMYRGFVLHPDDEHDPYVFRIDPHRHRTSRVVFSREPGDQRPAATWS